MKILNYRSTTHFKERMIMRRIPEFLISLCLAKGEINTTSKDKKEYSLNKKHILEAISQDYLTIEECLSIKKIIVVAKRNILITTYATYGDTGINYKN